MSEPADWPSQAWSRLDGPADAPILVLGNSLGTTAAVWDRLSAALRAEFRLLHYELPGHGGAAYWPGPYTIEQLGAGVLAMLDSRGIERFGYCGISLGGMVGMWLAAHATDRLAVLGLVCTSAFLPPATAWQARAQQVRDGGMAATSTQVVGRGSPPSTRRRRHRSSRSSALAWNERSPRGTRAAVRRSPQWTCAPSLRPLPRQRS